MSDKRSDYITWDEYFMGVANFLPEKFQRPKHTGGGLYCESGQ